jgi:hypothetical protein
LKKVLDHFQLTDGRLLRFTTQNDFLFHSMTRELQSALDATGIVWPAMRNYIPRMAVGFQLAMGAFLSSVGVKGRQ